LVNVEFLSNREGDSILVEDDRIASIGWEDRLRRRAKASVDVVDCRGYFAIPGLTDSHMHLLSYGLYKRRLDLSRATSIEDIKKAVARKARELGPGKWIIGRGWDQEKLIDNRMPDRWDLDEVAPKNPVLLFRVCGHVAVANSYALKLANIEDYAPDPPVGHFGREGGKVNGVLYEGAVELVEKAIGKPSLREAVDAVAEVLQEAASYGLVELHAMSVDEYEYRVLKLMDEKGLLELKVKAYLELDSIGATGEKGEGMLRVCGVKVVADGSFGARTAYLREPYSDSPSWRGELLMDAEDLVEVFKRAERRRLEVAVHAIGDGAIEEVLKAVEESGFQKVRLEHASLTPPDLIDKIAELKIPVSVQPHFILSDWWIVERLGPERTRWIYAYKSLLSKGALIAGSSDAPVEPLNPWLGVYAAVDRGKKSGLPIWRFSSCEALKPREALNLYLRRKKPTNKFTDRILIKEGCSADLTVISECPFKIENIQGLEVILTVVEGRVVYKKDYSSMM